MLNFTPKNPDFRTVVAETFSRQQAMRTLGISIARLEPGEADLAMDYSQGLTQQNGFVHAGIITAGLDTACGMAAFTLMPVGSDILTVEFKINLLNPAAGDRLRAEAMVRKGGRTLVVVAATVSAIRSDRTVPCGEMLGTFIVLRNTSDVDPRSSRSS